MTNLNGYISATTMPRFTKLGRVMNYLERLQASGLLIIVVNKLHGFQFVT